MSALTETTLKLWASPPRDVEVRIAPLFTQGRLVT